MAKKKIRTYYSLVRQRQADETRTRIAEAARKLILGQGYGAATIEAIAREAGVATPTVYAVFGSKRNILAELIDRAAFGPAYQDLVGEAMALADPVARLRMAPRIARQIYDAERSEIQLLREVLHRLPILGLLELTQIFFFALVVHRRIHGARFNDHDFDAKYHQFSPQRVRHSFKTRFGGAISTEKRDSNFCAGRADVHDAAGGGTAGPGSAVGNHRVGWSRRPEPDQE